jgi:hypothetical protein
VVEPLQDVRLEVQRQAGEVALQLSTELAPTTAVDTTGSRSGHASATWAGSAPVSRQSAS